MRNNMKSGMNRKVYVCNIPYDTTPHQVKTLFKKEGKHNFYEIIFMYLIVLIGKYIVCSR